MTWFESLTGFSEQTPDQVRTDIVVHGESMTSTVNGRRMVCGRLETPTLAVLRSHPRATKTSDKTLKVSEVIGDVQELHMQPSNAGALFQVASQFNLLEMVSPTVTPEIGVDIYEFDRTQGPACAIACGAGTIYRNYFAEVNGRTGQSSGNQVDCLVELGRTLGNTGERLWVMQNGYALATKNGLGEISRRLSVGTELERDALRQKLRIGVQWNTEVTLGDVPHTVSQAYCSALPVAYSSHPDELWSEFAQLVLEASYEAVLWAAEQNLRNTGNNKVFLTLLGGGAFGNHPDWIFSAIARALKTFANVDLEVGVVSQGSSNPQVRTLVEDWRSTSFQA